MTSRHHIAFDTTFVLLYIGVSAAMAVLSATLLAFYLLEWPFSTAHAAAAVFNVIGLLALPAAPRLYRNRMGREFRWTSNEAFGPAS